jgi:hypothetical protein
VEQNHGDYIGDGVMLGSYFACARTIKAQTQHSEVAYTSICKDLYARVSCETCRGRPQRRLEVTGVVKLATPLVVWRTCARLADGLFRSKEAALRVIEEVYS